MHWRYTACSSIRIQINPDSAGLCPHCTICTANAFRVKLWADVSGVSRLHNPDFALAGPIPSEERGYSHNTLWWQVEKERQARTSNRYLVPGQQANMSSTQGWKSAYAIVETHGNTNMWRLWNADRTVTLTCPLLLMSQQDISLVLGRRSHED